MTMTTQVQSNKAKIIKTCFTHSIPIRYAERGVMIRRPAKMKGKTLQGQKLSWPTLNKKHEVLVLGPIREQNTKTIMTDARASQIFKSLGYNKNNIYRIPSGGMAVFVDDLSEWELKQCQKNLLKTPTPKSTVYSYHTKDISSFDKGQIEKQQSPQKLKKPQIFRSPTPIRHSTVPQSLGLQLPGRSITSTPRPVTPMKNKKFY